MPEEVEEQKYQKAFLYSKSGEIIGGMMLLYDVPEILENHLGVFKRSGGSYMFTENGVDFLGWDYVKESDGD